MDYEDRKRARSTSARRPERPERRQDRHERRDYSPRYDYEREREEEVGETTAQKTETVGDTLAMKDEDTAQGP